jgi:hypothetical protein
MDLQTLLSELRSINHGDKDAAAWRALCSLLTSHLDDVNASPSLARQFYEEVLPALEVTLDRSWPPLLRVARSHDAPLIKRLARTLSLEASGNIQASFGETLGLKLRPIMSKAMIKTLRPHWLGEAPRFEALIIESVEGPLEFLITALLAANGAPLRHLYLERVGYASPTPAEVSSLMDLIISKHGGALESFAA